MITKITCRYSFEVLDFHGNDFGFTFNIGVSYLGIYKTSMVGLGELSILVICHFLADISIIYLTSRQQTLTLCNVSTHRDTCGRRCYLTGKILNLGNAFHG